MKRLLFEIQIRKRMMDQRKITNEMIIDETLITSIIDKRQKNYDEIRCAPFGSTSNLNVVDIVNKIKILIMYNKVCLFSFKTYCSFFRSVYSIVNSHCVVIKVCGRK